MRPLGRLAMLIAAGLLAGCQLGPVAKLDAPDPLPQPTGSYLDLGRVLLQRGRVDLAHDAFIRSIRTEGVTASALTGAGIAAERQGLLSVARRFFEQARDLSPESVVAHNNLGAVLYRLGEYHAARRAFQSAFALSSGDNAVAEKNLGLAELAIAREAEQNPKLARNPIRVQRLGTGTYVLEEDPTPAEQG